MLPSDQTNNQIKRVHPSPADRLPPAKRCKIDYSFTPFQFVPYEVIGEIFCHLGQAAANSLLNFEMACKRHLTLTTYTWEKLRSHHFFGLIDWSVCPGDPCINYIVSRAVVEYVRELPLIKNIKLSKKSEKSLIKFKPICKKFPLFEALVELAQLTTDVISIPSELAAKLKQDPLLDILSNIYQFAITMYNLKTQGQGRGKKGQLKLEESQQQFIAQFNRDVTPRIKEKIAGGATYISLLAIKIFQRYYLMNNKYCMTSKGLSFNDKCHAFVIELAHAAYQKGDHSSHNELRRLQIDFRRQVNHSSENKDLSLIYDLVQLDNLYMEYKQKQHIECKKRQRGQNGCHTEWKKDYQIVPSFFVEAVEEQDSDFVEKKKKLWIDLQALRSENDMPVDLLPALFRLQLNLQNWTEADRFLEKILEKEKKPSLFMLWAAAKLKTKLKKWGQAFDFYDQLKKTGAYLQDINASNRIYLEAIACYIRLKRFKEVDVEIHRLFKAEKKQKNWVSTKPDVAFSLQRLQALELISFLGISCDPGFSSLGYQRKMIRRYQTDLDTFLTAHFGDLLTEEMNRQFLYEQSLYQIPLVCLYPLAYLKYMRGEFQEAYDIYHQIAQEDPIDEWGGVDITNYLSIKCTFNQYEEAEQLLQSLRERSNDQFQAVAFRIKCHLKKWREAETYIPILCYDTFKQPTLTHYRQAAYVKVQLNKLEEAAELYQLAWDTHAPHQFQPVDYGYLIYLYRYLGREQEADQFREVAIQLYGKEKLLSLRPKLAEQFN